MTTILAEYLVTDQTTLLFVVRHDEEQPRVEQIALTRADLAGLIARGPAAASPAPALDALVTPLDRHCEPGDTIWFVPHDVLHYLPLHALRLGDGPLIDRNPVCYTPSASVMRYCQAKRRPDSRQVLVYADPRADMPLVHAREQAVAIARLFGDQATLRMGAQAGVTALEKDVAAAPDGFRILHLACHGRYDPERPLRSSVLLSPDGNPAAPDGELSAERILTMALPADLVTISACESGTNARHPGDELIGLTRALIYAGAASVLVSLWAVDEVSTSLLMQHFYRELLSGTGKAEALRRAQRRLRDMTAAEVVDLCERAASAATGEDGAHARLLLEESIADVRFRAGDHAGAQAAYELLLRTPAAGPRLLRLEMGETRSRWAAAGATRPADYTRKIYEDPYYWAAFILVGDWR